MKISEVYGIELLDSRGNPTVAAEVILEDGSTGFAIAPSGASTGMYEAHELRDNDATRYLGKGVKSAVDNINNVISAEIRNKNAFFQREIDERMIEIDGTENKSKLGANSILAVSLAVAKAAANSKNMGLYQYIGGINAGVLPRPMMNILNGGAHASNNIDIQEFMIIPLVANGFSDGIRKCSEIYHNLGKILKKRNLMCGVGDEGGFAPNLQSDDDAFELILESINEAGYTDREIKIGIDAATSEWYSKDGYIMPKRNKKMSDEDLIKYYEKIVKKYNVISIEDGLAENDWSGWKKLTNTLGNTTQLVGDDLFVTNYNRLQNGIEKNVANTILIKPNQIGTLTETLDVINLATKNNYKTVISHRSGESEDTSIADIAVGVNSGQIKTGAPCRSDRVAKYNRLMVIEKKIKCKI